MNNPPQYNTNNKNKPKSLVVQSDIKLPTKIIKWFELYFTKMMLPIGLLPTTPLSQIYPRQTSSEPKDDGPEDCIPVFQAGFKFDAKLVSYVGNLHQ